MDPLTLLKIDQDLEKDEVAQLKFLCADLIHKKDLEMVTDAKDLFKKLEQQDLLEDDLLISELLITIRRLDLLTILEKPKEQVERDLQERGVDKRVSPYRKMLFELFEDMTDENLSSIVFLLDLPKAKREKTTSFLDIIIEMEKQQKLGEDNLDELKDLLDNCDKQLAKKIETFRNRQRYQQQGGRLPLQEVCNNENNRFNFTDPMDTNRTEGRRDSSFSVTGLDIDSQPLTNANRNDDVKTDYNDKDYYTIIHKPVGYCLIINNFDFKDPKLRNRTGTEKDEEELKRVFKKMHFEVMVHRDQKASDMLKLVQEFAKMDHSQMDVFVCCVLSHGEKGTVYGVDGELVEIRKLTQTFAYCQTLVNKPKLFFIQACQGKVGQQPVWMADGQNQESEETGKMYEADAKSVSFISIPLGADCLIGMATVEDYQSFRHTLEGSIYIQELCRKLEEFCPRGEDILSILTKVNNEVSTKLLKGFKQMPEPRYTLRRKLVLPMD